MRRPEWPSPPARQIGGLASHRQHRAGFQRLRFGHGRQDAGQAFSQHGLAGAGRADQQQVMAADGGNLQRATRLQLAADVGQIRDVLDRVFDAEQDQTARVHINQKDAGQTTFTLIAIPERRYSDAVRTRTLDFLGQLTGASYSDSGLFAGRFETVLLQVYQTGTRALDVTDHPSSLPLTRVPARRPGALPLFPIAGREPTQQAIVEPLLGELNAQGLTRQVTSLAAFSNRYYTSQTGVAVCPASRSWAASRGGNRSGE